MTAWIASIHRHGRLASPRENSSVMEDSRARKLHCEVPVREATAAAHIFILATPRQFGVAPAQNKNPGPRPGVFATALFARSIRHHGLNLKLMPARTMFSVNFTVVGSDNPVPAFVKQVVVQFVLPRS